MILLNPSLIFFITWIPALLFLIFNGHHGYSLKLSGNISIFIFMNLLILLILNFIFGFNSGYSRSAFFQKFNFLKLHQIKRIINLLFFIWFIGFILNIFFSGGFPLLWLLTGDSRNYTDFGIPTFSGLLNMIRCFLSTLLIFLLSKDTKSSCLYLLILTFLIFSVLLLELSRGNAIFLFLHVFTAFILFRKKSIFKFLFSSILIILTGIPLFYLIKMVRTTEGLETLFSAEIITFGFFEPILNYIFYPLLNLNLYFQDIILFNFEPNYSLSGFVPTFIRQSFFDSGNYGQLVNEAFNTSTFFVPFLIDYGVIFTLIIVSIIYSYCYLVFYYVNNNSVFAVLMYPSLVASLYLSIFSLYFTTLVVILYPSLVLLFLLILNKLRFKIIK